MIITDRRIGAFVALLMLASACNGDADEPATLPDITTPAETVSPTPTPTPTPTVEPPVEPTNAHDYSAEGVEAFTRYAIDVINYAYQTNDITYLEQIMTPDCQTCANVVSAIEGYAEVGAWVDGGQMIVEHLTAQEPAEGVRPGAVVDLTVTASEEFDGSGRLVSSEVDRSGQFVFFLAREGASWKLDGLAFGVEEPVSQDWSQSSS